MASQIVFGALQALDSQPLWTAQSVGGVLGFMMHRDENASDQYSETYRILAPGVGPWESVEFRVLRKQSSRGIIILDLRKGQEVPVNEVERVFGHDHTFEPPNPRAPTDEASSYLEYKRHNGALRAVFVSFQKPDVTSFVLDRLEN